MRRVILAADEPARIAGGSASLIGLASSLERRGWNPLVVSRTCNEMTSELKSRDIPTVVHPFEALGPSISLASLRTLWATAHLLRNQRPDLLHLNAFHLLRSFAPVVRVLGIPYIAHVRYHLEAGWIRWLLRSMPKPHAIIYNSQAMMEIHDSLIRELAPRSIARVIHNGVDVTAFRPVPEPDSPTFRVGMVANFAPFKRHEDFLEAARLLVPRLKDFEFWIIGTDVTSPPRLPELEALARRLRVEHVVRFLGHRTDIPALLGQIHVLAVPSENEPFGRVAIEAMATGRPVVAASSGGLLEIVRHGENGLLFEVKNPQDLADRIETLATDRALWQRMSDCGVEQVRRSFTMDAHADAVAKVYDEVAKSA